ncbi:guanylate kinase [Desulfovibrio sp. JC022]|uniref:guanylate kinase n=1 Tax=Desulfovibrio sp. JC022 TaxID=2593642 RepID=UPI0013D8B565|nr:guanylate kinase [Desulfovibrio sp. JC022]NDV22728.1 guanylate kinase [Desulfovibrio sp. JC022]
MTDILIPERKGQVLVICAPSGTGKSTLVKKLREEFPQVGFSISCTTRDPREGEVDGKDYFFHSVDEFNEKLEAGEFAEWAEVHGNFYGTPKKPVEKMLFKGMDILFDIDFQGCMQLMESMPEGIFVFLMPPSYSELRKRLEGRNTDTDHVINRRMLNAMKEMASAPKFEYWIVNDDLEKAYGELRAIYLAGKNRPCSNPGLLESILSTWE